MIVAEMPYETADPTVDSQIVRLKASGADIFFNITTPKFAAQAIKKVAELGWKPVHILNNVSGSIGSVLRPAGLRELQGHPHDRLSARTRPIRRWQDDPGYKAWIAFMDKYYPGRRQDQLQQCERATPPRGCWCRCSSSAATISRART